jgi:microcystin-dependent protein
MQIGLATPGADDGVWGDILNEGFQTIDVHDHSPGRGVPIPTSSLVVVGDLALEGNSVTGLKKLTLNDQGSALFGTLNQLSINTASGNLYWTNGAGTAVQITDGAGLNAAAIASPLPVAGMMPYAGTSAPLGWLLCDGSAVSRVTYAALFAVIGVIYGAGDGATTFNLPNLNGRVPVGAGAYTDSVSGPITRTLGQVGGAEAHVVTIAQMPAHAHTMNSHLHTQSDHQHYWNVPTSGFPFVPYNYSPVPPNTYAIVDWGLYYLSPPNGNMNFPWSLYPNTPKPSTTTVYTQAGFGVTFTGGADYVTPPAITGSNTGSTTASMQNTGLNNSHNNMQPFLGLNYIIRHIA